MTELIFKLQQFNKAFETKIKQRLLIVSNEALRGSMLKRIFEEGLDSNDTRIGNYSTKPMYASRDAFVKKSAFKGKGKVRAKTKTMYLDGGYSQFRQVQGRDTSKVNLDLTGDLRSSIQTVKNGNIIEIGITSDFASKKGRGNERRFNKEILKPSTSDLKYFEQKLNLEIQAILNNTLRR